MLILQHRYYQDTLLQARIPIPLQRKTILKQALGFDKQEKDAYVPKKDQDRIKDLLTQSQKPSQNSINQSLVMCRQRLLPPQN